MIVKYRRKRLFLSAASTASETEVGSTEAEVADPGIGELLKLSINDVCQSNSLLKLKYSFQYLKRTPKNLCGLSDLVRCPAKKKLNIGPIVADIVGSK